MKMPSNIMSKEDKEADLHITERCNQNCIFCFNFNNNSTDPKLKDIFLKLDNFKKKNVKRVFLNGGEPTLRKDLVQIIKYSKNANIQVVDLFTNGTLLNKKYLNQIISAGIDKITYSLHSHDEEISDFLTNDKGGFKKTISSIKNSLNYNIEVKISFVINSKNYKNISDFVKFIDQKIVGKNKKNKNKIKILFSFVRPLGNALKNKFICLNMRKARVNVIKGVQECKKRNIRFFNTNCSLPLCYCVGFGKFTPEYSFYRNCTTEYILIVKNKYNFNIKEFKRQLDPAHNFKGDRCNKCSLDEFCFGLWEDYYKHYGAQDLIPQTISPEKFFK
jgi:MoaA/NifB/PqqE/SkfB family radical SAM enzyme